MALTISVVTPSFNQGGYIDRTIESVLCQGVPGLEYVVVDGGSTDGTLAILRKYGERIRWQSEKDGGQADALNKGIRGTRGAIIGWLNSDDIYYPGAVQFALDHFAKNPECDLVYGDAHHIDEHGGVIERYPTEPWNADRLREVCFLCQPAVFFRRRVAEQHGEIDPRLQYCMDYEFWLRLARRGARFDYLPKVLAGSRLHQETKTLSARVKVHREINDMMRRSLGVVPDRWLYNYAHCVLDCQGISRQRRFRFAAGLAVLSCYASVRWNRRLSRNVINTTARWVLQGSLQPRGEIR